MADVEEIEAQEEVSPSEDVVTEDENLDVTEEEEVEEETEEEEVERKPSRAESRIRELIVERDAYQRMAEARPVAARREEKEEELPAMDPEVEQAVNARINRVQLAHQRQLGQIVEQLDEAKAETSIPDYKKVKTILNDFREKKAEQGVYFTRQEAYELLSGRGDITAPRSVKKVTVIKSKPKVGIERKTSQQTKVSGKKSFANMTFEEKEKHLENQAF